MRVLLAIIAAGVLWPTADPVWFRVRRVEAVGTSPRPWWRAPWGLRAVRRPTPADEVDRRAAVADLVAVGLEAGLPITGAWALAHGLRASASADPGPEPEGTAADLLDHALVLSARAGTPAGVAARSGALALHRRASALRRREALLAGPRASMFVLSLLPVVGPLLVAVVGLDVRHVYGDTRAWVSVVAGVVLTGLGWVSARAILAAAIRPSPGRGTSASGP